MTSEQLRLLAEDVLGWKYDRTDSLGFMHFIRDHGMSEVFDPWQNDADAWAVLEKMAQDHHWALISVSGP